MLKNLAATTLATVVLMGAAPPGNAPADPNGWNENTRAQVLGAAEHALGNYFFTDKVGQLRASIESHRDAYLKIDDPQTFAQTVSSDLYAVGHDRHVRLVYSADVMPPNNQAPTKADIAHFEREQSFENYGFAGAFRLRGNIGYLRLLGFGSMPESKAAIDAAMTMLAPTDALIIDVRHNRGGDPDSLDYLMGYFYAKPVELTSIVATQNGKTQTFKQFSAAHVTGQRYLGKPLYVLVDDRTFSCAEQFAYDMKALHRATLIGKTTGGGANPGGFFRLDDHFAIFVPLGQAQNPYTKTNWEGVGVAPDLAVAPETALAVGYGHALTAANDSFDEAVDERNAALKDPNAALTASLPEISP